MWRTALLSLWYQFFSCIHFAGLTMRRATIAAGGGEGEPNTGVCEGGVKFDPAFHLSITLHAYKLYVQGLAGQISRVKGCVGRVFFIPLWNQGGAAPCNLLRSVPLG